MILYFLDSIVYKDEYHLIGFNPIECTLSITPQDKIIKLLKGNLSRLVINLVTLVRINIAINSGRGIVIPLLGQSLFTL